MPPVQLMSNQETRSRCTSNQCPACGASERVTLERIMEGATTITLCHCRACGHSWKPDDHSASP